MVLTDMTDVRNGNVSPDMLLGLFTIFSVPGQSVPTHDFKQAWAREGLPESHIADGQRPVHVFQRACESVRTGARGVPSANRLTETSADLVSNDADCCVYQITRLTRDKANQVIEHEKAMTIVFDKAKLLNDPDLIRVIARDVDSFLALRDVEQRVKDYFDANLDRVPDGKVRGAIRSALSSVRATPVRKAGGCYFVPMAGLDTCEAMQRVLATLYGDDASFDMLPQLNSAGTRDLVKRHHTANVREETEALITKITARLKSEGSKPRTDMVAGVLNDRRSLGNQMREYQEMLGESAEAAEEAISMLDEQIEKLMAAAAA